MNNLEYGSKVSVARVIELKDAPADTYFTTVEFHSKKWNKKAGKLETVYTVETPFFIGADRKITRLLDGVYVTGLFKPSSKIISITRADAARIKQGYFEFIK